MPFRPTSSLGAYIPPIPCEDGREGCTESYAAMPGLLRGARRAVAQKQSTWAQQIQDPDSMTLVDIESGLREGDPQIVSVVKVGSAALGSALLNILYLVGPDVILVGGPVIEQVPEYFALVEQYTREYGVITPAVERLVIARPQLTSDEAVALGVAQLAFEFGCPAQDYATA